MRARMLARDTLTGLEPARKHRVLHLICELEHTIHIRLALLAFFYKRREFFVHSIFTTEERIHFIFLDREACLD